MKSISQMKREYKEERKDLRKQLHAYADIDDLRDFQNRIEIIILGRDNGELLLEILKGQKTESDYVSLLEGPSKWKKLNMNQLSIIRARLDHITMGDMIENCENARELYVSIKKFIIDQSVGTGDMIRDKIRFYQQDWNGFVSTLADYTRGYESLLRQFKTVKGEEFSKLEKSKFYVKGLYDPHYRHLKDLFVLETWNMLS